MVQFTFFGFTAWHKNPRYRAQQQQQQQNTASCKYPVLLGNESTIERTLKKLNIGEIFLKDDDSAIFFSGTSTNIIN